MKRLWLALFLCLAWPVVHQAQASPTLAELDISLWPEYDRPAVLVIYRGQLDATAAFPLPLEMSIPADAGPPSAVAYVGEDGGRFNLEYTTRVEGDAMIVAFELPTAGFQLEYYDQLAVAGDSTRQYTFTYIADHPVTGLSVEFQEPPTAEGFELSPAADSSAVAGDGLRYHQVEAGSMQPGDRLSWTFQYVKDDDGLTTAFFQQASPSPAAAQPPVAPESNATVALFVVAFVALVAVGVSAYWLGQRTQAPTPRRASTARRVSAAGKTPLKPQDRAAYFCHKCGAEIRGDSHFCHSCGAAVRRES